MVVGMSLIACAGVLVGGAWASSWSGNKLRFTQLLVPVTINDQLFEKVITIWNPTSETVQMSVVTGCSCAEMKLSSSKMAPFTFQRAYIRGNALDLEKRPTLGTDFRIECQAGQERWQGDVVVKVQK